MTQILQLGAKRWDDPSKVEARRVTLINPIQEVFGARLPADRQYWGLCGEMADGANLQPNCELGQLVTEGILKPRQYNGVEANEAIHLANVAALHAPYSGARLYHGEFTEVLDEALGRGTLRPGVVYLDTIQEPRKSTVLLAKTLNILNYTTGTVMLIWNVILANHHRNRHHSWGDVTGYLRHNDLFRVSFEEGWVQAADHKLFRYAGTGRSNTTMGTVVFLRRGEALPLLARTA
jgi:hypothetical protein